MTLTAQQIYANYQKVKEISPLVHNITNFVVMDISANALLALGASPIMAHAPEEMEDLVSICSSLVLNIGTLSKEWNDAKIIAGKKANDLGKPIVLDPVGAGASKFRNETLAEILNEVSPTIIRGNASEILSLALNSGETKGVDSTDSSDDALEAARILSQKYDCTVVVSGETDYIIKGDKTTKLKNGDEMMTKVTGVGCSESSVCGAFAGAIEDEYEASVSAMAIYGVVGQIAKEKSNGPGSFRVEFMDLLYNLTQEDFEKYLVID